MLKKLFSYRIDRIFLSKPNCQQCSTKSNQLNYKYATSLSSKSFQREYSQQYSNGDHSCNSANYSSWLKILFVSSGAAVGIYLFKNKYVDINLLPSVSAASLIKKPVVENSENLNKMGKRKSYNFIADAVERVSEGVVFISIKSTIKRYDNIHIPISNGSGIIVNKDGLIMTNAHVVGNKPRNSKIQVRLADGREFEGRIEDLDATSDLALVRINCKDLHAMDLGISKDVRLGEFVVAVGSPLSLSNTITSGVVSSVGREASELGVNKKMQYIQTDASITFGNSGGPLINLDGEVIGINSMKVSDGISFAIPIDHAKKYLNQYYEKVKSKATNKQVNIRRYLGIRWLELNPDLVNDLHQYNLNIPHHVNNGLLISAVSHDSPAFYAGLNRGDIIIQINGKQIESTTDLYAHLESLSDLNMVILRNGQKYHATVTPEEP